MLPFRHEIEHAAYHRWERRGRLHGHDRDDWVAAEKDLTFERNYRTIVELPFLPGESRVVASDRPSRCRFCEQSTPRAAFSIPRPIFVECSGIGSIPTRELCDECAEQFAGSIDMEFARFWHSLEPMRTGADSHHESISPSYVPTGAYKALIRMAVLLTPEADLANLNDAIEWVANPDHEFDSRLFDGLECLVYTTHAPHPTGWAGLACRVDKEAPIPWMLFFLASSRIILQVHLPLCLNDEDLDGMDMRMPERSFSTGIGPEFRAAKCLRLPVRQADSPPRRRVRLFA
jgi:hypothetical protein